RQFGHAINDARHPAGVLLECRRGNVGPLGVPGTVVTGVVAPLQAGAEQDEQGHESYSYISISFWTRSEKNSCPTTSACRVPRAVRRMTAPSRTQSSPASASQASANDSRAQTPNAARKARVS